MDVLLYLYANEINIDADSVVELLFLSCEYMIVPLKIKCLEFIVHNLDVDNVVDVYNLCSSLNLEKVKARCHALMLELFDDIVCTEKGFSELDKHTFELIMQLNAKSHEVPKAPKPPSKHPPHKGPKQSIGSLPPIPPPRDPLPPTTPMHITGPGITPSHYSGYHHVFVTAEVPEEKPRCSVM